MAGSVVKAKKLYSVAEFMRMPDNGKKYELLRGELVEMPGPNVNHGEIIGRLFLQLGFFLDKNPLGVVRNELAFELGPKTAPIPDLAFITTERWQAVANKQEAFQGAPDLAIEVMSPTDKWSQVSAKVKIYQEARTRLVWVVDPFDEGVTVYRLNKPRRLLLPEDYLDSEDIVPGFTWQVKSLFE